MATQFVWDEKYSVGNEEIDDQHKSLFALGNQIPEASSVADINPLVIDLFKYTREHFLAEEAMMKRIGFPYLEEHQELHMALIEKLSEVSSNRFVSTAAIGEFKELVFEWLTNHIMTEDYKYFVYAQSQG